jgi:hypothetical protein
MIRFFISAIVIASLVFAACGDDDDGNDNGGNQPQATGADAGNSTQPAGGSDLPTIDEVNPHAPGGGVPELDSSLEVETTDSGLRYIDEVVGTGAEIENGQVVTANYAGWLTDGTEFDSGEYTFPLGAGQVIAGWDEGIESMNVGGKRRLIIPSELAYGPQGRPPTIPPAAVLIFDVEVLAAQ